MIDAPPKACPGVSSDKAGKQDGCAGCPNQQLCSSGEAAKLVALENDEITIIQDNLSGLQFPILILSGKGGVGKSTITCQLAYYLANEYLFETDKEPASVGVLDVDLCGPSVPTMLRHSFSDSQEHENESLDVHDFVGAAGDEELTPVMVEDQLAAMSLGYLLPKTESSVLWRGPKKHEMIKKFLKYTNYGPLDYLLIDTPPGTSDEHLSLSKLLKYHPLLSAIIVTTPQEIALQDVRKEIDFCINKAKIPIIGVIENMSEFICPNCDHHSQIFNQSKTSDTKQMAHSFGLPFLGSLPLDPIIGKSCDQGRSFIPYAKDSPCFAAFQMIVHNMKRNIATLQREKQRQTSES